MEEVDIYVNKSLFIYERNNVRIIIHVLNGVVGDQNVPVVNDSGNDNVSEESELDHV